LLFTVGGLLLVAATLALILSPFRRSRQAGEAAAIDRKELNAAIYRDELAELKDDLADGSLSQADYEQSYAELQRRVLEDSIDEANAAPLPPASRKLPVALGLSLPVVAALLYLLLGTPAALNPPPPPQQFTADDIEKMVAGLAAKLENEPENRQGWVMLARSYKAMGRLQEAVSAYGRAGSFMDDNADLLLDYADTLAASIGGFDDKVRSLIDQALKLDPKHPQGLWLRGTVAYDAKRYDEAIADWEALLALLPPDSEDAGVLKANIAEVRELQGKGKVGAGKTAAAAR
jgi:cytochrome c-type biogenesis protein CcmH